jgi:hypothetical protein
MYKVCRNSKAAFTAPEMPAECAPSRGGSRRPAGAYRSAAVAIPRSMPAKIMLCRGYNPYQ